MKPFIDSFLRVWREFTVGQKTSIILAAFLVLGGLVAVGVWSGQPDYQLLYGRLAQKDAAVIISSLQTQNIKYRTSADGSSVYVPAENIHRLRMDLASKGLPSGEGVGFEIFDKGQFGLSDFAQRTNYARALQGELSRTIAQLDGVAAARVMIVQPENRLLLVGQSIKPTASVFVAQRMVGTGADAKPQPRTADELQGLRKLVINAIGLKAFAGANANANVDDLVTIQEAAFQSSFPAAAEEAFVPTKVRTWIELSAKYVPVLIAVLAFGFFFRLLRTQRLEAVPMEVINPPRVEEESELPAVVTAATLNELLRKKPGNIGAALRDWSAEAKT